MNDPTHYDYIIAGSGCAGLSLAVQLKRSSVPFTKVLIVDKEKKDQNDRTWCYWTNKKSNWFDEIVHKRWDKFYFRSNQTNVELHLKPYQYQLIRGIDFYAYCLNELKQDARFEFVSEEITKLSSTDNKGVLKTTSHTYSAKYIFNSAIRIHDIKPDHINYVQHFKGYVVNTQMECFEEDCPVFMDFRVPQHNDCRFVYIIPFSKTKALIEYTGFSKDVLKDEEYDTELKNYIQSFLKLGNYSIEHIEKGLIPMAESEFVNPFGKCVINIGTAGGYSKPSTGFTFYFIQQRTKNIIDNLLKGKAPEEIQIKNNRHKYYDKILLDVMDKKQIAAKDIFEILFRKNDVRAILAFLNEETTLMQDLRIMNSVPKLKFIPSAIKKLVNK
ncbi:MAG: lycopene cyclase family protein [Sphingobacteriaceae bacterium]|jgi:lycopene beta-cyclase